MLMNLGMEADRREFGSPATDVSRREVGRMQLGSRHDS